MDLPFEVFLTPGNVLKGPFQFPDGYKGIKRIIILTSDNQSTLLFVTATSKIHGEYKYYRQNDIYIPKGDEDAFKEPTYVKMNRIIEVSTHKLIDDNNKNRIKVLKPISQDLLDKIYDVIDKSNDIKGKYINRIRKERETSS